jgi:hypothetical protein
MDREIVYAIIFAVASMAVVGSMMLAPRPSASSQQHTYAPEDIRYSLQQADAKKKRKAPVKPPAPQKLAPPGTTSTGGGDNDPSDEPQEEPSLSDEGEAEEPPLD